MSFDERNEAADTVSECLSRHPEFPFHGAYIADALRSLLENGEMLSTQTTAKGVGGIQRKTALPFQRSFDGMTNFASRHSLDQLAMEARCLDGPNDFVLRICE